MFHVFGKAVNARYSQLAKGELFSVDLDLQPIYLAAFPEGSNPVYKVNTEHDCSCCKNFLRNLGSVISIKDGVRYTVWQELGKLPEPYDTVAKALHAAVMAAPISGLFRTKEPTYGAEMTRQSLPDGSVHRWNHFWGAVAKSHLSTTPDKVKGDYATTVAVFKRGLEELTSAALSEVKDLIDNKLLYRGEEHKRAVDAFVSSKAAYASAADKEAWLWENASGPAARFRNTVIGTLVQDLSEGKGTEKAVAAFESKVAPANYKRPSALITPAMVSKAVETLGSLGLDSALQRRHAKLSDVSVNNVLWVNNSAKAHMKNPVESLLMQAVVKKAPATKVKSSVTYEEFVKTLLPQARSMEVFVEGHHLSNLMSLTTAQDASAANLWQWGNPFAWSYRGDMTDSIKERVKRAGGNTGAAFRVSLAWFNHDDLDIHVFPPVGRRVYYGDRQGVLDVDMQRGRGTTMFPVENCSWTRPEAGTYRVHINQFSPRMTDNVGFELEVESNGKLWHFSYPKLVRGDIPSLTIQVKGGTVTDIKVDDAAIVGGGISREEWGVTSEKWVPVDTLMYSPNHWDGESSGHKHVFFLLNGCKNPEGARGLYNEFLSPRLQEHRKVFEVLGSKMKCPAAEEQLSGLGFSTTTPNKVNVRLTTPSGVQDVLVNF